jgi:hypothetical protein
MPSTRDGRKRTAFSVMVASRRMISDSSDPWRKVTCRPAACTSQSGAALTPEGPTGYGARAVGSRRHERARATCAASDVAPPRPAPACGGGGRRRGGRAGWEGRRAGGNGGPTTGHLADTRAPGLRCSGAAIC